MRSNIVVMDREDTFAVILGSQLFFLASILQPTAIVAFIDSRKSHCARAYWSMR